MTSAFPTRRSSDRHQLRAGHGGGVDRHLVGAGPQQAPGVVDGADAATDREGDEDLLGGAAGHLQDRVALVGRRGDVEEDDLVGALAVVARSEEHTSELQSLMRTSYAVFCLK